ncbi:hypothetical protein AMECASPLE_035746 [Ameca splendens]|uniref:Uncharacterized protein n=1 Tax=Ameca splendens TaxID=208324 RepID=A0ABV0ZH91_9TELE
MDSLQSFISFLLSSSGSSPPILPHQHFVFSLRRRSTRSLAPPTDIHHGNACPGSSLRLEKGMTADFLWRHYPNKAQFRMPMGGSRGLPAYKPPPFHNSFSFHAGLRGDRIGEAQSALRSFAGKKHNIQLDPRSHTIIDHMPS